MEQKTLGAHFLDEEHYIVDPLSAMKGGVITHIHDAQDKPIQLETLVAFVLENVDRVYSEYSGLLLYSIYYIFLDFYNDRITSLFLFIHMFI